MSILAPLVVQAGLAVELGGVVLHQGALGLALAVCGILQLLVCGATPAAPGNRRGPPNPPGGTPST